ncbi:hypothetical protein JRQ81_011612 [Phrynocephalus forsythii]|uniref:Phospholipase A2 inhibitor and Ly6/PLAUR domain-containing protein-like n=1 Tax=Phrynocephalus forsythii TaxID=171643 RepID=A0A9Q0X854_9SAUR|nr:hypothetical protein JRQ81_011612 [Phrynocephalus forsythii]
MQALRYVYLFGFITTGASLECEHCYGLGSACRSPKKICPVHKDICYTGYSESTLEGTFVKNIIKGCESTDLCSLGPIHLHISGNKYYNARYACCPWNNCQDVFPKLRPIENEEEVAVQCPSCYSWTGKCGTDVVNCTRKETYCFFLTLENTINGTTKLNTMKGCTSKAVCEAMQTGFFSRILKDIQQMNCSSLVSKGSWLSGLLPPTLFGLLLQKVCL